MAFQLSYGCVLNNMENLYENAIPQLTIQANSFIVLKNADNNWPKDIDLTVLGPTNATLILILAIQHEHDLVSPRSYCIQIHKLTIL